MLVCHVWDSRVPVCVVVTFVICIEIQTGLTFCYRLTRVVVEYWPLHEVYVLWLGPVPVVNKNWSCARGFNKYICFGHVLSKLLKATSGTAWLDGFERVWNGCGWTVGGPVFILAYFKDIKVGQDEEPSRHFWHEFSVLKLSENPAFVFHAEWVCVFTPTWPCDLSSGCVLYWLDFEIGCGWWHTTLQ